MRCNTSGGDSPGFMQCNSVRTGREVPRISVGSTRCVFKGGSNGAEPFNRPWWLTRPIWTPRRAVDTRRRFFRKHASCNFGDTQHLRYNRSVTFKIETVSNLTWRRRQYLCVFSRWPPVGQRAAPVITHLVQLRLRQRSRGHLVITLHITAIFLNSHNFQRFQQPDDAILIHQTDKVIAVVSPAANVLTAGGWRGRGHDNFLLCCAPFCLHSASVALRGNLGIFLVSGALLGDHGCRCWKTARLWTQGRTASQQMLQLIFKSSRNWAFQFVTEWSESHYNHMKSMKLYNFITI